MPMRGIRGATTAAERTRESVLAATEELLRALVRENSVESEDVAGVLFTASPDLSVEYPAAAARVGLGWTYVSANVCSGNSYTARAGKVYKDSDTLEY